MQVSLPHYLSELSPEQVQRWVVSLLVLAISSFPLGALAATSILLDSDGRTGAALALIAVMAVLGAAVIGAMRLVHERSPMTPWMLAGLAPAVMTALFVL
jgi:hypothetical protein